jgi:hypothetical protein
MDNLGSILGKGKKLSSSPHRSERPWDRHPTSCQWVPGTLSLWAKRLGLKADNSRPSSADVKNNGAIPVIVIVIVY